MVLVQFHDNGLLGATFAWHMQWLKMSCRVSIVAEQFIRMLHHVGMPKGDLDYIQGNGRVVGEILKQGHPRSTLFTGSQKVAEQLALDLKGKVRSNVSVSNTKSAASVSIALICRALPESARDVLCCTHYAAWPLLPAV